MSIAMKIAKVFLFTIHCFSPNFTTIVQKLTTWQRIKVADREKRIEGSRKMFLLKIKTSVLQFNKCDIYNQF